MAPDPAPGNEQTFTATVMTRIRARVRRRRILTNIAIGLTGAAVLTLAVFIIARTLANLTLTAFPTVAIIPTAIIAAACIAMMFGYESIIARALMNHEQRRGTKRNN